MREVKSLPLYSGLNYIVEGLVTRTGVTLTGSSILDKERVCNHRSDERPSTSRRNHTKVPGDDKMGQIVGEEDGDQCHGLKVFPLRGKV